MSTFDIEGVETVRPGSTSSIWSALTGKAKNKIGSHDRTYREENDPGIEAAQIEMKPSHLHSAQRYTFEIDALEDVVAILPTKAVPGWNASLDGVARPVFPAGPDMVGVIVPRGAHDLSFEWRMPDRHVALMIISVTAVVIALLVWLLSVAGVLARWTPTPPNPARGRGSWLGAPLDGGGDDSRLSLLCDPGGGYRNDDR